MSDVRLISELVYRRDADGLQAAREQLVSYSARLLDDGLAVGSAGNLSMRVGDLVAITPSGISYAEMRPADICVVDLDGAELRRPARRRPPRRRCTWRSTRRPGRAPSCTRTRPKSSRCPRPATNCPPSTTRSPASAARSGSRPTCGSGRRAGRGGRHGAGRPQRRHPAQPRRHLPTAATWPQAYDRALLLEWLARIYRLALSYGEPAILSHAELDEVTAESRRRRYGDRRSGQP